MDLVVNADTGNARWAEGSIEYVTVFVTRTDGALVTGDVTGMGFSTYYQEPATWYPPTNSTDSGNTVTAKLLVGAVVQPTGFRWLWVRVSDGGEHVVRVAFNVRFDFTEADWLRDLNQPLMTSPLLLTSPSLLTSAGV